MRNAEVILIPLLACAAPAAALEIRGGSKNPDHRVCDVVYNPNDIVDARGVVGETLTIHFRSNERIGDVATSDAAHLKWSLTKGSNTLWLKATMAMPNATTQHSHASAGWHATGLCVAVDRNRADPRGAPRRRCSGRRRGDCQRSHPGYQVPAT